MTAAMSFLVQSQQFLVRAVFDGFHRLVNDAKLAGSAAGLVDARLAAQSLWSVNYGPYGSGVFFDEKVAALEYFFQVTTAVPLRDLHDGTSVIMICKFVCFPIVAVTRDMTHIIMCYSHSGQPCLCQVRRPRSAGCWHAHQG